MTYSGANSVLGSSGGARLSETDNSDLADIGAESKVSIEDKALARLALGTSGLDQAGEILGACRGDGMGHEQLAVGMETDNDRVMESGRAGVEATDGSGDSTDTEHLAGLFDGSGVQGVGWGN